MVCIREWLIAAERALRSADISSARLDAELLLADVLKTSRTWLLAHDDESLTKANYDALSRNLARRLKREPLAYIRGYQEFYGRRFHLNPHVLIPRPETEIIIEKLSELPIKTNTTLVDVGTGSGCIAISAKLEYPQLEVVGTDISSDALSTAKQNAIRLSADISFLSSDLLRSTALPQNISIIIANLPYIDHSWSVSPETAFEPSLALYADNAGLALIVDLLEQAMTRLNTNGHLLLEADTRQHDDITSKALALGLYGHPPTGLVLHFQKH